MAMIPIVEATSKAIAHAVGKRFYRLPVTRKRSQRLRLGKLRQSLAAGEKAARLERGPAGR